jgi:hypothetical protein
MNRLLFGDNLKWVPRLVTLSLSKGLFPDADFVFVRKIPRYDKVSLCYKRF